MSVNEGYKRAVEVTSVRLVNRLQEPDPKCGLSATASTVASAWLQRRVGAWVEDIPIDEEVRELRAFFS